MITTTLVILACLFMGFLIGRMWERERYKIKGTKEPKPVCGCKHHYALHDADGLCHSTVQLGTTTKFVTCQCQRYTGPEPLPRMITGGE